MQAQIRAEFSEAILMRGRGGVLVSEEEIPHQYPAAMRGDDGDDEQEVFSPGISPVNGLCNMQAQKGLSSRLRRF